MVKSRDLGIDQEERDVGPRLRHKEATLCLAVVGVIRQRSRRREGETEGSIHLLESLAAGHKLKGRVGQRKTERGIGGWYQSERERICGGEDYDKSLQKRRRVLWE